MVGGQTDMELFSGMPQAASVPQSPAKKRIAFDAKTTFEEMIKISSDKSTGLAAIETLMQCLKQSQSQTVIGLTAELHEARDSMLATDYSSVSLTSASELFFRFISLVHQETDHQDMEVVKREFLTRGKTFVERIRRSRSFIAESFRPFIRGNFKVLMHSYSKVALGALLDARDRGLNFHVYITESQPDNSGRLMYEKLQESHIATTLILDSAVGYIMEQIDIVIFGAEGVMETGGIINKIGSLSIAICAKAMNKPVYVMAESIKFVKEYPLNQADIPDEFKYRYSTRQSHDDLEHEHPLIDYTPPQYINLLITDLGIFTPAAVGDELIKLYT